MNIHVMYANKYVFKIAGLISITEFIPLDECSQSIRRVEPSSHLYLSSIEVLEGFSRIVVFLDQYRFYTGGGENDDEAFPQNKTQSFRVSKTGL